MKMLINNINLSKESIKTIKKINQNKKRGGGGELNRSKSILPKK
jgi:hypothetical protein